jgi:hypothetical protein
VDGGFNALFTGGDAAAGLVGATPPLGFDHSASIAPFAGFDSGSWRQGQAIGMATIGDPLPCSTDLSTGNAA